MAFCLLLSLVLHGSLLIGIETPPAVRFSPPAITLRWQLSTPPPENGAPLRSPAPTRVRTVQRSPAATIGRGVAAADGASPGPPAAPRDLLESALRTARDEGVRIERRRGADGLRRQSPEGRLARVLAPPPAGETLLANGTYRITTRAGTRYCLNELPAYHREGMVDALRIASTCP